MLTQYHNENLARPPEVVLAVTTPTSKCLLQCMLGYSADTCKKCTMLNHDTTRSVEFNTQALADYGADSFGGRLLIRLFGRDGKANKAGKYSLLYALDVEVGEQACTRNLLSFELCFTVPTAPTTRPPPVMTLSKATTMAPHDLLETPEATRYRSTFLHFDGRPLNSGWVGQPHVHRI